MIKIKKISLVFALLAVSIIGLSSVQASAKSNKSGDIGLAGQLSYKKISKSAKLGSNYAKYKLYNHVPNSDYKNIKTTSWKKSGLNLKSVTKKPVKINMKASQGTQYDWYRFSVSKKHGKKTVKTNYWIYGQAFKSVI